MPLFEVWLLHDAVPAYPAESHSPHRPTSMAFYPARADLGVMVGLFRPQTFFARDRGNVMNDLRSELISNSLWFAVRARLTVKLDATE